MSYKLPVAVFYEGYIYTNVIPCKITEDNGKKWAHIEKLSGETRVVAEFTGELDWEKPYYIEYHKLMNFINLIKSKFPEKEVRFPLVPLSFSDK